MNYAHTKLYCLYIIAYTGHKQMQFVVANDKAGWDFRKARRMPVSAAASTASKPDPFNKLASAGFPSPFVTGYNRHKPAFSL